MLGCQGGAHRVSSSAEIRPAIVMANRPKRLASRAAIERVISPRRYAIVTRIASYCGIVYNWPLLDARRLTRAYARH